ncbi:MAG: lipid A phosphoethanolamine transferase [Muribaculaceae bacterium]|nr:lipid A phosphoethanolamine transferase [Muribaculaceae bacterium]MDE7141666.1 lipid A phosphoethanolamine transferase [Muribaculaceae bacterium]
MRKFHHIIHRSAPALLLWVAAGLIAPNIALSITEPGCGWGKAANILLPLGVYLFLLGLSRKTGRTALLMIPFMFFAAFQVVLLSLYGESVIAVDMFLNVATTSYSEASELLTNLLGAMVIVVATYLTAIVWGILAVCHKARLNHTWMSALRRLGSALGAAGLACAALGYSFCNSYSFEHETFPVNAMSNLIEAADRSYESKRYPETSSRFSYNAKSTRPTDEREVYIMVVGETSRALNWQLAGYERPTNPRLSETQGVTFFPYSITESNTTHKSVPMLLSHMSAENFDELPRTKSIVSAFKEAGFRTAFFSNQPPNGSYTQFFADEADRTIYIKPNGSLPHLDEELLKFLREELADSSAAKKFVVLHTYGSHFLYRDRYPSSHARFLPDDFVDASVHDRDKLVNSFDNTILYTDSVLSEVIGILAAQNCRAAMFYSADHGEDIFDDSRERFLHASPNPTYYQLRVATLCWLSDSLRRAEPRFDKALQRNRGRRVSPQKSLFPSMLQAAGISSPYITRSASLLDRAYAPTPAVYLNDLNQALLIENSGLKKTDIELLKPYLDK